MSEQNADEIRKSNFFSRQDIGGNDPERFRLSLQVANLKMQKAELIQTLQECEQYFDNIADADNGVPNKEMQLLATIREVIKKTQ